MFWKNEYTRSLKIADDLEREDITLTELLEDQDILQEYRSQNKNLVEFFKRDDVLEELVNLITKEPPTNVPEVNRYRYSNIACEILTSNQPTLIGQLVVRQNILEKLYAFLEQDSPLNPLLSSFFSKTFGMLISRQQEQDWFSYQCVCLQVLEFIKNRKGFLCSMYKHIGTTAIMDLLFHIITDVKGPEAKSALFEWLREQQLIHRLIDILGNDCDTDKHNNIAQLICDLITTGRTERQNVLQEPTEVESVVSDILINALEDESITKYLLDIILSTDSTESTIVSGIQILLKLLENPIINEPVSDTALQFLVDAETDHHRLVTGRIFQQISPKIDDFHALLLNPPKKPDIQTTVTLLSPPFGITRLSICTLFTVLIETKNPLIIQSICESDFFNTLLKLFKQYCWNNILHNQVKKCVTCAFKAFDRESDGSSNLIPSALQKHIIVNCKIVSKLIDCWMHNKDELQSTNKCRLGYMGHLIEMFDLLVSSMLSSDQFRALVETNIDEYEQDNWNSIIQPYTGELAIELKYQKSFLAGIDPAECASYTQKFQEDDFLTDYNNETESNMQNSVDDLANAQFEEACNNRGFNSFNFDDDPDGWGEDFKNILKIEFNNLVQHADEQQQQQSPIQIFNRWDIQNNAINETKWATFSIDNFADFDQHFDAFQSTTADFPSTLGQMDNDTIDNNMSFTSIFNNSNSFDKENQSNCSTNCHSNDDTTIVNHVVAEVAAATTTTEATATSTTTAASIDGVASSSDNIIVMDVGNSSDNNANDVHHHHITNVNATKETDDMNLTNSIDAKQMSEQSSLSNTETAFKSDASALLQFERNAPWNIVDDVVNQTFDSNNGQSPIMDVKPAAEELLIEQPKLKNCKLSSAATIENNTTNINNTNETSHLEHGSTTTPIA